MNWKYAAEVYEKECPWTVIFDAPSCVCMNFDANLVLTFVRVGPVYMIYSSWLMYVLCDVETE